MRSCQHNVEVLHSELSATHGHRRMICVPVEVPPSFYRYLKSAASRSFGPNDDSDKSGVDFAMRTIGRRSEKDSKKAVTAKEEGDEENETSDEDGADQKPDSANDLWNFEGELLTKRVTKRT